MKKIGVLHSKERSFPEALVARINSKNIEGIVAEPVKIDKVMQGEDSGYASIEITVGRFSLIWSPPGEDKRANELLIWSSTGGAQQYGNAGTETSKHSTDGAGALMIQNILLRVFV